LARSPSSRRQRRFPSTKARLHHPEMSRTKGRATSASSVGGYSICRVHNCFRCEDKEFYCEIQGVVQHVLAQFRGGRLRWRWQAKGPSVKFAGSLPNSCPDDPRPRGELQRLFCVAVGDASVRLAGFVSLRLQRHCIGTGANTSSGSTFSPAERSHCSPVADDPERRGMLLPCPENPAS